MNNHQANNVNANFLERPSRWKRVMFWILGTICTLCLCMVLIGVLVAGGGERIQSLSEFARSPWLFVFRLGLYAVLWLNWERLIKRVITNISAAEIKSSRRPLLVLLIVYELFFASNALSLINEFSQ